MEGEEMTTRERTENEMNGSFCRLSACIYAYCMRVCVYVC